MSTPARREAVIFTKDMSIMEGPQTNLPVRATTVVAALNKLQAPRDASIT